MSDTAADGSTPMPASLASHRDRVSSLLAGVIHEMGPGARLPSERALAEELGVSRTALRDRLQMLQSLGVIVRRRGAGTFVQQLDSSGLSFALDLAIASSNLHVEDLHRVRIGLERQAAIGAARARDPVLLGYLRKALDGMIDAADSPSMDEADFTFHVALMRAAGSPALGFFADALSGVLSRALAERRREMRDAMSNDDRAVMIETHSAVYAAVNAGDVAAAVRAIDRHFRAYVDLVGGVDDTIPWRDGPVDPEEPSRTRPAKGRT
jgi:GntR family transcriptional repressor for pyruvate dehydrogenase complex